VAASRTLGVTSDDDASRVGLRTNVEQRVGDALELGGHASCIQSSAALPYRGGAEDASNVIVRGLLGSATIDSLTGYLPAEFATSTRERAHHLMTGATAVWRLTSTLSANAVYGRDQLNETDVQRIIVLSGPFQPQPQTGHTEHALTTVGVSATTTYDLSSRHGFTGVTTGGYQRVLASASARQERSAVFGAHLPNAVYKSADMQWLAGRFARIDSLRLRAAYGEANDWHRVILDARAAGTPCAAVTQKSLKIEPRVERDPLTRTRRPATLMSPPSASSATVRPSSVESTICRMASRPTIFTVPSIVASLDSKNRDAQSAARRELSAGRCRQMQRLRAARRGRQQVEDRGCAWHGRDTI
jgi:hypothetical protein